MYGIEETQCAKSLTAVAREATLGEGLLMKKNRLEIQLAEVNEAIAVLDANPEMEKLLNLINKTGRY